MFKYFIIFLFFLFNKNIFAWKNHSLITEYALEDNLIIDNKNQVQAESLDEFLSQTSHLIPNVLLNVENWAIQRSQRYPFIFPETPVELKFNAQPNDPKIVEKFLHAIRVNPTVKLPLFIQILPGESYKNNAEVLKLEDVVIPSISNDIGNYTFIKINNGELINPIKVLATASDEPDYGLDINLFDDNIKEFKEHYNFGNQPFGNANFSFSSQAPFHMGFYHQSPIIYKKAEYLKRTYAEYRIKLFQELSIMAFKTKHSYWGYRFLGWSLHYIQDLSQPFHNAPIPGFSTADLIGLNIFDKIEGSFYKTHINMFDTINIITNRHLILEKLIYDELVFYKKNNTDYSKIVLALKNSSNDTKYLPIDDNYIRQIISKEAFNECNPTFGSFIFWKINEDVPSIVAKSFPKKYTFDSKYIYNNSFDAIAILNTEPENIQTKMYDIANKLMQQTGSHTRKMVQYVLQNGNI